MIKVENYINGNVESYSQEFGYIYDPSKGEKSIRFYEFSRDSMFITHSLPVIYKRDADEDIISNPEPDTVFGFRIPCGKIRLLLSPSNFRNTSSNRIPPTHKMLANVVFLITPA